jgi:hypothetical protein
MDDDMMLALQGCGSHDDWLDALERYIADASATCPCCGSKDLRLHAVLTQPSGIRATVSFWCDRCLWGLMPNAIASERVSAFMGEQSATPPDYRIVQP